MKIPGLLLVGATLLWGAGAHAATLEPASCASLGLDLPKEEKGVVCGWVEVPESRNSASKRRVRLPVVVARALGKAEPDPVVYLHGGPGIATLEMVPRALKGKAWPALRATRDLVFFDQRGTGRSTPRLCADLDDEVQKIEDQALAAHDELAANLELARACRKSLDASGTDLAAYNAVSIAADMEDVRKALGYKTWNVFATSYGTLPGMESVRRYPSSVRSILIDSSFPSHSQYWAEQITITGDALSAVQRRCDSQPECKARYPGVAAMAGATISDLDAKPLQVGDAKIDGGKFLSALWTALVQTQTVTFVPELLKRASARDEAVIGPFVGAYGGPNTFGSYSQFQALIVNCHEIMTPSTRSLVARAIRTHPGLAGTTIAEEQDLICAAIQPSKASIEFFQPVESSTPALVFAGEFDPATPAIDAYATARFLKNATVVEVEGASHAPFYTDDCTRSLGVAFFANPVASLDTGCLLKRPAPQFAGGAAFDTFISSLK